MVAAATVGIHCTDRNIREHSRNGASALHPAKKAWMGVAITVRPDVFPVIGNHLREITLLHRHRLVGEELLDRIRYRLPDPGLDTLLQFADFLGGKIGEKFSDLLPVVGIQIIVELH